LNRLSERSVSLALAGALVPQCRSLELGPMQEPQEDSVQPLSKSCGAQGNFSFSVASQCVQSPQELI
jgi:hypothetical protein